MGKFKAAWKVAVRFVDDNLPTILSCAALIGLGASVVTAAKEAPKAQEMMDMERHAKLANCNEEELSRLGAERITDPERIAEIDRVGYREFGYDSMFSVGKDNGPKTMIVLYNEDEFKFTLWEKFKVLAPVYWPCALVTAATGACIISSNVISKKRYLGLAALVATQAKDFDEYKEKVKSMFGEKKEQEVKREVAKDKMADCPKDISEEYVPGTRYPMNFLGCWWSGTKQEVEHAFSRWNNDGNAEAIRALDNGVTIHLEDLTRELECAVKDRRCHFPSETFLNHIYWNVSEGAVYPKFTPAETVDGVPGFLIEPSRTPDSYE